MDNFNVDHPAINPIIAEAAVSPEISYAMSQEIGKLPARTTGKHSAERIN